MNISAEQAFSRNLGFLSSQEQEGLYNSSVAIAGAGGDGGMLALQLARLGVGELRLADPEPFETENLNRQACCTSDTIGVNKAQAVASYSQKINPDLNISVFDEGITPSNVQQFVEGADLVIDETEFTLHTLGVSLARQARQNNIVNLMAMNIGFGATVTSFHPKGKTFEEMLGLDKEASLEELESQKPKISHWLPYIPAYGDMDVFKQVASEEKSAPSIAPGVAIAAGMAATQAVLHLVGNNNKRPDPVYAPRVFMIDAMSGESKIIKHPVLSHYRSLITMAGRNLLKLNPATSY